MLGPRAKIRGLQYSAPHVKTKINKNKKIVKNKKKNIVKNKHNPKIATVKNSHSEINSVCIDTSIYADIMQELLEESVRSNTIEITPTVQIIEYDTEDD